MSNIIQGLGVLILIDQQDARVYIIDHYTNDYGVVALDRMDSDMLTIDTSTMLINILMVEELPNGSINQIKHNTLDSIDILIEEDTYNYIATGDIKNQSKTQMLTTWTPIVKRYKEITALVYENDPDKATMIVHNITNGISETPTDIHIKVVDVDDNVVLEQFLEHTDEHIQLYGLPSDKILFVSLSVSSSYLYQNAYLISDIDSLSDGSIPDGVEYVRLSERLLIVTPALPEYYRRIADDWAPINGEVELFPMNTTEISTIKRGFLKTIGNIGSDPGVVVL